MVSGYCQIIRLAFALAALSIMSIVVAGAVMVALLAGAGGAAAQDEGGPPETPTATTTPVATTTAPVATVSANPRTPAAAAQYEVSFTTEQALQPFQDGIVMTLHEDIRVPTRINPFAVQVRASKLTGTGAAGSGPAMAVNLEGADDPRRPTTLTVIPGPLSQTPGQNIAATAQVTITFTKQAGLINPTEGGAYPWTVTTTKVQPDVEPMAAAHSNPDVRQAFGEPANPETAEELVTGLLVDREVILSHESVRRGAEVTLIGRGYKNGTTLTFWRDANFDGRQDSGESTLCRTEVSSNDIGFCTFKVSNPPFAPGPGDCDLERAEDGPAATCNFLNGKDGRSQTTTLVRGEFATSVASAYQVLELDGGVLAGPEATPGQPLLVQLTDFPAGELKTVDLGGVAIDLPVASDRQVPASGTLDFSIDLPSRARPGQQSLRVVVTRQDNGAEFEARATLLVGSSAWLEVTPARVVPNQRISVSGYGFSGGGADAVIESISIGSHPIDSARINGGGGPGTVRPDSAGRWSASIDLPVNPATTQPGDHELKALSQDGREGMALLNFPARQVTITPPRGRPGTTAVVAGRNFPGKNDNGSTLTLLIVYDTGKRQVLAATEPDANGNFSAEIRIPTAAPIPSSNTVWVEFADDAGVQVITPATHRVPGAGLVLSRAAGPPGTALTLAGQGFRQYIPVNEVTVGAIEVTPSPRPYTDQDGNLALEIVIPGLNTGLQTITVAAGGITVSADFTVVRVSAAGAATPVESGLASLGERFTRSFHFDNAAKTWTFYDPAIGAASTQQNLVAGESYWLLVTETTEAVLNGRTRNLTCLAANCWNLIVW